MAREKKLEIKVTPDGGASIDPEELFRKLFEEPAEREALKRLSAAAQKQIRRRAEARRLSAAGAA